MVSFEMVQRLSQAVVAFMWTDAHAHLAELSAEELEGVIGAAQINQVTCIAHAGTDLVSSAVALEQSSRFPSIVPLAGITPFDVPELPDDWLDRFRHLVKDPRVRGIGEIGLDESNPAYPSLESQIPVFEALLEVAAAASLPAVVHSRGCEQRVLDSCRNARMQTVVFHCYTGTVEIARDILDAGYFISLSGIITFKSQPLVDVISLIPLKSLLLETDSPYLAPVPHRGKTNQPSYVPLVGRRVADVKHCDLFEIARATSANFHAVFGV